MVDAKVYFSLIFIHTASKKLFVGNIHRNNKFRLKFRLAFRIHIRILLRKPVVRFHLNSFAKLFQHIFQRKCTAKSVSVRIAVAKNRNVVHIFKPFAALLHSKLHSASLLLQIFIIVLFFTDFA